MRYYLIFVTTCSFLSSIIAFINSDYGYGLVLLGGSYAWLQVTLFEIKDITE